jgi:uncharacterized protein (DUF169 family)
VQKNNHNQRIDSVSMTSTYASISARLTDALNLGQPPVGICFTANVPAGVHHFDRQVPAGCRFWQEALEDVFATSGADHNLCAIGVHTHHLQPSPEQQTDLQDALMVFAELGYVRPQDIPLIPVLDKSPQHVIYGPLAKLPIAPDLVLLFVHANQTMILSEATQQIEASNPPAMGRPACAVVPQVMNTGRAALSLGCCGARAYLDVLVNELAVFAIPGSKLDLYADRIETLSKANNTLTNFHRLRREDVEAGHSPTIKQSLAALASN